MIDPAQIQKTVADELAQQARGLRMRADWMTPSGRQRSTPMYEIDVQNRYLDQQKTIKGSDENDVARKARAQLERWAEQELRRRLAEATENARDAAKDADDDAKEKLRALGEFLNATLAVDDRINWDAMLDRHRFPDPAPIALARLDPEPAYPKRTIWLWVLPFLWKKRLAAWEDDSRHWQEAKQRAEAAHAVEVARARAAHETQKTAFLERQRKHNEAVRAFRERFEAGDSQALEEYIRAVFERSVYPDGFYREYVVNYDPASKTAVVDVALPSQDAIPKVAEIRFDSRAKALRPIEMKPKDHAELYDSAVKQCILRTVHEVFEAVYTPHVASVVVNGWVTAVDAATGHDRTACVVSLGTSREDFSKLNLARIDPTTCIKNLKGLIAGPLSELAPVKPILQLNREDSRFIESKDVLDEIGKGANLAEMPWEEFEHLVRELFGRMFAGEGAEVRVTRASNDGGVDAVAFDPDPIRGGKFVIQAKRFTRVVPVAAVRELYGTMINEGASRGVLVTTAHFGREARQFAQDKPIALMDGANLVYELERHGYAVRIDVEAARQRRRAQIAQA